MPIDEKKAGKQQVEPAVEGAGEPWLVESRTLPMKPESSRSSWCISSSNSGSAPSGRLRGRLVGVRVVVLDAEDQQAEAGSPGEGERERREQRHRHRDGEGAEEDAGDAGDGDERQKDDDGGEGRADQRDGDFPRALRTASRRLRPASRCITMFSTTTIASSMTRPTALRGRRGSSG